LPGDHLNWNILDPEKYYYRGAYMDCARAMQFLMSRPEVDTSRVGVEGSSQGGALALATAALDNRVAACSADVPFLCDFPSGVVLCTRGGLSGLRARFEASTPEGEAMRRTLSYIDGSFMAAHIQCPTLIAVGQMDRTCPPQGGAAAYNHLSHRIERKFMAVTNRDHEVMPEWRTATDAWFRKFLKGGIPR
jgi:cephalosporin-C deacetylase-like acetyl esterase